MKKRHLSFSPPLPVIPVMPLDQACFTKQTFCAWDSSNCTEFLEGPTPISTIGLGGSGSCLQWGFVVVGYSEREGSVFLPFSGRTCQLWLFPFSVKLCSWDSECLWLLLPQRIWVKYNYWQPLFFLIYVDLQWLHITSFALHKGKTFNTAAVIFRTLWTLTFLWGVYL